MVEVGRKAPAFTLKNQNAVMEKYGAWGRKLMYGKERVGVIRSTVLIAPDGKVAHHWKAVKAAGHAEQVRAKLQALRAD